MGIQAAAPDADATWIGHYIVPRTLDEVISFYFRKSLFKRKIRFLEGHHGSEKYYKQHFLLLLLRILQTDPRNSEGKYSKIENYKLPDLHVNRLSDLIPSIGNLITLADELKQENDMLAQVGIDVKKLEETFAEKLIPFLNKLKGEAKKQISAKHRKGKISPKKVAEFKEGMLSTFYEKASIRDIFIKYFNAYEDRTKEKTGKKEPLEINNIDDKAAFFDEWYVHYTDMEESYGRDLASVENYYLLDKIAKNCEEISKEDFEAALSKIKNPEEIVIFTTNFAFWQFFENSKNFSSKRHGGKSQLKVKGFIGWYDFNGKPIPVFQMHYRNIDKQILILNRSKIGQLVQLSPLSKKEKEESVKDIFYMDIQAFSENEKLMEELIKQSPDWLKKMGDKQEQQEYLQERVRIQVLERFEYNSPEDFEGYKLFLKDD